MSRAHWWRLGLGLLWLLSLALAYLLGILTSFTLHRMPTDAEAASEPPPPAETVPSPRE